MVGNWGKVFFGIKLSINVSTATKKNDEIVKVFILYLEEKYKSYLILICEK